MLYLKELLRLDRWGHRVPPFSSDDAWRPHFPEDEAADVKNVASALLNQLEREEEEKRRAAWFTPILSTELKELYVKRGFTCDRYDNNRPWDHAYAREVVSDTRLSLCANPVEDLLVRDPFVRFPVQLCTCKGGHDEPAAYLHCMVAGDEETLVCGGRAAFAFPEKQKNSADKWGCDAVLHKGKTVCAFCAEPLDDDEEVENQQQHPHFHKGKMKFGDTDDEQGWCKHRVALTVAAAAAAAGEGAAHPVVPGPTALDTLYFALERDLLIREATGRQTEGEDATEDKSDAEKNPEEEKHETSGDAEGDAEGDDEGDGEGDAEEGAEEDTDVDDDAGTKQTNTEPKKRQPKKKNAKAKKPKPSKKKNAPVQTVCEIAWDEAARDQFDKFTKAWDILTYDFGVQVEAWTWYSSTVVNNYFAAIPDMPKLDGVMKRMDRQKVLDDAHKNDRFSWIKAPDFIFCHALSLGAGSLPGLWKCIHNAARPEGEEEEEEETQWNGRIVFYDMTWPQLRKVLGWLEKAGHVVNDPCFVLVGQNNDRRYILTVPSDGANQAFGTSKPPATDGLTFADRHSCVAGRRSGYKLVGLAEFIRQHVRPGQTAWSMNELAALPASSALLLLGCRVYTVPSKPNADSSRAEGHLKFAATLGHPEVATIVYGGYATNLLGRMVTAMTVVEHASSRPRFDPTTAILRRVAPPDRIVSRNGTPHRHGPTTPDSDAPDQHPYQHSGAKTGLKAFSLCDLKDSRETGPDGDLFTYYQSTPVVQGALLAVFPTWVFAADFAPTFATGDLAGGTIEEPRTCLHDYLLLLPPARHQSFDALRVLDSFNKSETCALKFDQESWQLQLTAKVAFGFNPDANNDDESAGAKDFDQLWAGDEDEIRVREGRWAACGCICVHNLWCVWG